MSAWIVSKGHIDCLVQALIVEGLVPMAGADECGRMLWAECLASVAHRYPNDRSGERPGPRDFVDTDVDDYKFRGVEAALCDAIVKRQVGCYRYQSCEHPGWGDSLADRLTTELTRRLVARHGGDDEFDVEWESAHTADLADSHGHIPWGIDEIEQAVCS